MLKARTSTGLFILGIDAENVKRMKLGHPILVRLADMGGHGDVAIMYGDTLEHIRKELEDATGEKLPEISVSGLRAGQLQEPPGVRVTCSIPAQGDEPARTVAWERDGKGALVEPELVRPNPVLTFAQAERLAAAIDDRDGGHDQLVDFVWQLAGMARGKAKRGGT